MSTTQAKADAAVAKAGENAQGGDAADDLIGQLVAQARGGVWTWSARVGCCGS